MDPGEQIDLGCPASGSDKRRLEDRLDKPLAHHHRRFV
jgi:hypothetical protein